GLRLAAALRTDFLAAFFAGLRLAAALRTVFLAAFFAGRRLAAALRTVFLAADLRAVFFVAFLADFFAAFFMAMCWLLVSWTYGYCSPVETIAGVGPATNRRRARRAGTDLGALRQ